MRGGPLSEAQDTWEAEREDYVVLADGSNASVLTNIMDRGPGAILNEYRGRDSASNDIARTFHGWSQVSDEAKIEEGKE